VFRAGFRRSFIKTIATRTCSLNAVVKIHIRHHLPSSILILFFQGNRCAWRSSAAQVKNTANVPEHSVTILQCANNIAAPGDKTSTASFKQQYKGEEHD
jgi:hypothetical protein